MIPQIKEVNFPEYATISTATATLQDMGDKTISAQVKIDGRITPNFSYDWEVEFQGERYIQPLREPQASKGNDSLYSNIDLTFQHWTIYQLKRYYFVQTTPLDSDTAVADKYIASLGLNLKDFIAEFENVLGLYFKQGEIKIKLNPQWTDDKEPSYMDISYTHIWDVLLKLYEVYGVRWHIDGDTIMVGYDTEEVSHSFEYGFEGGLLKVERQVQSDQIANSLLGRGGEKNLPYRYFKDVDEHNPSFKADPNWIPELKNISFTNLRGKTFRDYVKGWKAKHYDGEPMAEPTEAYTKGFTDEDFDPIEYVEDKESIKKYDLLQNGLDNVEDIFPTIQGVEVDGLGRVDEVVGVERVTVDEVEGEAIEVPNLSQELNTTSGEIESYISKGKQTITIRSSNFKIENGVVGHFVKSPSIEALCRCYYSIYDYYKHGVYESRGWHSAAKIGSEVKEYHLYDAITNKEIQDIANVPNDIELYVKYTISYYDYPKGYDNTYRDDDTNTWRGSRLEYDDKCYVTINISNTIDCNDINGAVLGNYTDGNNRISATISNLGASKASSVTLNSDTFEVPEDGATNVDVPVNIITSQDAQGLYEWQRASIEAVNVDTNEVVSAINIPQGTYYLRVEVEIKNLDSKAHSYTVELMPSYVYYPTDSDKFKPKFGIWIKNIWGTTREQGESEIAYVDRVWTPILGDRQGDEAKVVFSTGLLSGHSDWEFPILDVEYAGNKGVQSTDGIPAEWKLTLAKSDAEVEATGLYIPSTQQQATVGDKFFFIGIDMPHQYVLWAEEKLDQYKRDQLLETANIKPTWVVQTDKVRLNEVRDGKKLLDSFKVGNTVHLLDERFSSGQESLYLQSITYTWDSQTIMFPNVEVVLSDKVTTSSNPVSKLQGEVDVLTKQVGSLSNIQQVVRVVGDRLYLRKDGVTEEVSNSRTKFANTISSKDYRQGAVGGNGWGLRSEQGKGVIEADKLIVRDEMQVNSLVVNQVSAIGGKEILSAASITCSRVETTEQGFKCYFDQKRGTVANQFVVHDIAYSQVYNPNNVAVKYYKREVIEVGDNYILLSLDGDGNGAPQSGDVIVQYGNTELQDRQYVIIRDVIGGGYERMLCGLDSIDSNGIEYFFAGRMEGGTPRWFVGDTQQYAKFEDGKIAIECKKVGMTSEGSSADTVRIWAGADNENKSSAPFRVQQNGKVFATDGEFRGTINMDDGYIGGFIRKKITRINDNNVADYVAINSEGHNSFNVSKVGSLIYLEEPLTNDFTFAMPTYYKGQAYDMPQGVTVDDLRGMLGNYLLIYNFSDNYGSCCGKRYNRSSGEMDLTYRCYTDWRIKPNEVLKLTCTMDADKDGEEVIFWDVTKLIGKQEVNNPEVGL